MAYKFQLGAAVLSGSINVAEGAISGSSVSDTLAASIVSEIDTGEIPIAKLASSTISGVSLGSNLNALSKATNGGVNFTSYNGSAAVGDLQLAIDDLAAVSIANGDFIAVYDADGDVTGKEAIADVATLFAGGGLAAANSTLEVSVSGALKVASDKVGISGSFAGTGLTANGGVDSISSIELDIGSLDALGGTGLHQTQDHFLFSDNGTQKKITFSNLQDAVFADVSGDATIAAGGALTIAATSVENGMLAGSIANGKLANSDITIGSTAVALGGTQTSFSGLTGLDFTAANASIASSIGANNLTLGGNASTVIVAGNLTVQGTTTTVDSTTINVSSSFTFEGVADANETTLGIVDPDADRTVFLPNASGVLALFDPSASDSELATALTVVPSELNLLDGGTARGTTALADGDGIIHNDGGTMRMTNVTKIAEYVLPKITGGDVAVDNAGAATIQANAVEGSMLNNNIVSGLTDIGAAIADTDEMIISDAGTIRRMDMSRLKTYIGSGTTDVTSFGDEDATLAVGVNYASANTSQARTLTLPASAGMSVGQSVKVKAAGVSSGALTIARAGSQTIDGNLTSIKLESDNAAVELVYVAADDWRVF